MAKIKGSGFVGIVKALRSRRGDAERVLEPALHRYLHERAVVAAWYPEEDYLELLRAYVRVWPERSWEDIGTHGAREMLSGIYRNVIVNGDLRATAAKMRVNWRNYHDTGDLTTAVTDSRVRVQVEGYAMVSRELCKLNEGYFRELLATSGTPIWAVHKLECTSDGAPHCSWDFEYATTGHVNRR